MNNDLTDEQRARARELRNIWASNAIGGRDFEALPDRNPHAWLAVEAHVLASHTCEAVWRPVAFEEIQPGWEVRTRRRNGSEATWGVAHHQDDDGDWCTDAASGLTYRAMGWTYETTAPKPEPEPELDPRVKAVAQVLAEKAGISLDETEATLVVQALDRMGNAYPSHEEEDF